MPGLKNTAAIDAGWSSLVARQAHNLKVAGSNPAPATNHFDLHTFKKDILNFLKNAFFIVFLTPEQNQILFNFLVFLKYLKGDNF